MTPGFPYTPSSFSRVLSAAINPPDSRSLELSTVNKSTIAFIFREFHAPQHSSAIVRVFSAPVSGISRRARLLLPHPPATRLEYLQVPNVDRRTDICQVLAEQRFCGWPVRRRTSASWVTWHIRRHTIMTYPTRRSAENLFYAQKDSL